MEEYNSVTEKSIATENFLSSFLPSIIPVLGEKDTFWKSLISTFKGSDFQLVCKYSGLSKEEILKKANCEEA